MTTHIQDKIYTLYPLVGFAETPIPSPGHPIYANSLDYGFDFDEEELGRELAAPGPCDVIETHATLIAVDEFDSLYRLFIS